MPTTITIPRLEMLSPTDLRPKRLDRADLTAHNLILPIPEINRFFYTAVGGAWYWLERLPWSHADWLKYVDRPELQTWIVGEQGTPCGYFELEMQPESSVEIVYFGLLPQFVE